MPDLPPETRMSETPSVPMVTVSAFEWETLRREETFRALEARLSERFHRRFWILLAVGMILSIGGVQAIAFLVIGSRFMAPPAASYAQSEGPILMQTQAALRRAEEQTARANGQMAELADKIDKLNAKIASLETDNATLRLQLDRPATAAREPERRPTTSPSRAATTKETPRTASLPTSPPSATASRPAPGEGEQSPFRLNSEYELRLVVFGKTEATKMPPMQDYLKRLGYKVVADAAPDPKSAYPTRQDFVFISYRKGAKPEAQRIEKFLRQEFHIQTVLARYDVGDKLAGDIQIAFQESRTR
jgi:hypothetical protein